jgi:S1-C subfamily serine protease
MCRFSRHLVLLTFVVSTIYCLNPQPAAAQDSPPPATPEAGTTPAPTPPPVDAKSSSVENSVVKIFSTVRYPDMTKPWTKSSPIDYTGSGVVIEKNRILTNAHVALYASQIQVQANQSGDKFSATVEAIAPGIDLAVLKLDDEKFFINHPPLARANTLPEIKDAVLAYGYPEGGDSLSITKGIVSRIEYTPYNGTVSGLRIQIDAAINPGNSGGPAVSGDKMIGLAFIRRNNAENIGYIIPCEEIELFLKDIADGHYDGKPTMFDQFQTMENPVLRTFLKIGDTQSGVIIHKPFSNDPTYPLKTWDVISKIGDTPIDDQGMIKLGTNLRVSYLYLIQKIVQNGCVPLTVIREGKEMPIQLPVSPDRPNILPSLNGSYPSYFVYGPLVFSNATAEFMGNVVKGDNALFQIFLKMYQESPLVRRAGDLPAFPGERLVVVSSPFFPHKLAKGYSNPISLVLKTVNGIPIKNLAHLVEVLRDCKDEYVTFDFFDRSESLVFHRTEILAATPDILNDNSVLAQGSPDVLSIWNTKPPAPSPSP